MRLIVADPTPFGIHHGYVRAWRMFGRLVLCTWGCLECRTQEAVDLAAMADAQQAVFEAGRLLGLHQGVQYELRNH